MPLDLELFCGREYPRLVKTLALYCNDVELSKDVAQEALARTCVHWAKVRAMEAPGPWVHRVAMNLMKSQLRRRNAEERLRAVIGRQPPPPDQDQTIPVSLRTLVSALPGRQKTALLYRFFVDLSVSETAQAMGCSEALVKKLTRQAIHRLRQTGAISEVGEATDAL